MNQYKPGDRIKIISLEKVRSYPEGMWGDRIIGGILWIEHMDKFAGTTVKIRYVRDGYYNIKGDIDSFDFSPEMIEGPADPVEQEGQEELWMEVFNPPTVHGSYLKELLDKYTITRKK